MSDIRVGTASW